MPWIFGYGSLMWDPFFPYLRRERATLPGFHRAFVMSFSQIWGRVEAPCIVLGLEPGGTCEGVAYEVAKKLLPEIEDKLRTFEGEAFHVRRARVFVGDDEAEATVALSRSSHRDYVGRIPEAIRAAMVIRARGSVASCLEYVRRTAEALGRWGIEDQEVQRFLHLVEEVRRRDL